MNRNFSDAEIQQWLDKVISSKEFSTKEKTSRLLRFLVDETLAGRNDALKQYTIGTAVFKRAKNFNPDLDPVVRIQAGRLRRSLDSYYAQESKDDPIRITIPVGSYVPLFLAQHPDVSGKIFSEDSTANSACKSSKPFGENLDFV